MQTESTPAAIAIWQVLVAVLSGAGGSVLLELLWRPRRVRRRVAALLSIEIAQNTAALGLQKAMMDIDPGKLGPGFQLPTIVWDAAKDSIAELPEQELRVIVSLYSIYGEINRDSQAVDHLIDRYQSSADRRDSDRERITQIFASLQAHSESIFIALKKGREVVPHLRLLGSLTGDDPNVLTDAEYKNRATKLLEKRTKAVDSALAGLPTDSGDTVG